MKLPFLTANRVAVIVAVLTGLAAFITGLVGVLPHSWENYATIASGLLLNAVTVVKFLSGAQQWDKLQVQRQIEAKRGLPGHPSPDEIDYSTASNAQVQSPLAQ